MTNQEFNFRISNSYPELRKFTYKFTSKIDVAEDLVQETMFRALKNKEKFRDNTNFNAWLYTIMRNVFINSYRRSSKFEYTKSSDEDFLYKVDAEKQSSYTPYDHVNYLEVESAIDSLKNIYKTPFKMHIEGFKYEEISKKLNTPLGTIKTRIHTARKLLTSSGNVVPV